MWVTHMLGGLLNIPLMREKTQDMGWGQSHAVKRHGGREDDGREGVQKVKEMETR